MNGFLIKKPCEIRFQASSIVIYLFFFYNPFILILDEKQQAAAIIIIAFCAKKQNKEAKIKRKHRVSMKPWLKNLNFFSIPEALCSLNHAFYNQFDIREVFLIKQEFAALLKIPSSNMFSCPNPVSIQSQSDVVATSD